MSQLSNEVITDVDNCPNCGEGFKGTNGFVRNNKTLGKVEKVWHCKCTQCKTWVDVPLRYNYVRGSTECRIPKATKYIGDGMYRPERDRWFKAPADLRAKLAEEKKIREENAKKAAECTTEEDVDSSEC